MITCPYCGSSRLESVGGENGDPFNRKEKRTFCLDCGRPVEINPDTSANRPHRSINAGKTGNSKKMLLILFIIAALIGGGLLIFKNAIFGNSGLYERAMNKKLDKYEQSDKLIEDYVLFESGADYTFETLKRNIDSNDYHLKYYTTGGVADVIKYTLSDEVFIGWTFNGGFDELSNKTFVLRDGIIYEDGEQKIAYNTDSSKYGDIMYELSAYLPENCCCKGSYTSADKLDDPEQYLIAHIIRGDSDTVLYETTEDRYYEKAADKFIYIEITGPTEGDSVKIPEKGDYLSAE